MSEQTSQGAVLAAARELFTTKGFASTSVREICESAGVTPPVLYYHFGSKVGLFEAVVEETVKLDDFCQLLREAVDGAGDPWAKLRAYVKTYLVGFPKELLNPGLHFQSSTVLNAHSLRQMESGIAEIHRLTCELLSDGIAAGEFRSLEVDVAASCLMGTVDSFVRARVYMGVEYEMDHLAGSIVELYKSGLTALAVPAPV